MYVVAVITSIAAETITAVRMYVVAVITGIAAVAIAVKLGCMW